MMATLTTIDNIACAVIPAGRHHVGTRGNDRFAGATERPLYEVTLTVPVGISCDPVAEADLPVVNVSWTEANTYCAQLRKKTGSPWRLPSEAEWEIACRAGTDSPFSTGHDLTPAAANYYYNESGERVGPGRLTHIGTYPPNAWGLRDLHGNICEWCADAWHPSHSGAAPDATPRPGGPDSLRVIRGGAWDLLPRLLRSSWRDGLHPATRRDNLGFRLAITLG